MEEVKIKDRTYKISVIPPALLPFTKRISVLLKAEPKNFDEACESREELDKILQKVFAETVQPQPMKEDEYVIFNALTKLTNEALKEARFFRSGTTGSPQTAESKVPDTSE